MSIQDNPNIIQIEDMMNFCKYHQDIFIYDCQEAQIKIAKFLLSAGVKIKGFLCDEEEQKQLFNFPVFTLEEVRDAYSKKRIIL